MLWYFRFFYCFWSVVVNLFIIIIAFLLFHSSFWLNTVVFPHSPTFWDITDFSLQRVVFDVYRIFRRNIVYQHSGFFLISMFLTLFQTHHTSSFVLFHHVGWVLTHFFFFSIGFFLYGNYHVFFLTTFLSLKKIVRLSLYWCGIKKKKMVSIKCISTTHYLFYFCFFSLYGMIIF